MVPWREEGHRRGDRAAKYEHIGSGPQVWVAPNQLFKLRRLMHEGALSAAGAGEAVVPISEAKEPRLRIRELERLLGRKTMGVEILGDAVSG